MKKLFLVCILLLTACANPYAQFYTGLPDARQRPDYEPVAGELTVYGTDNFDRDSLALIRRGYLPIGQAVFSAPSRIVAEEQLREQAARVGAHVVLMSSKYAHAVSAAMPFTPPQTATSFSTGTATASGRGGTANANDSGISVTYGSQTVMMPHPTADSDLGVIFFAKIRPRIGIFCQPMDEGTRKRLQTNDGVLIKEVIEGSPAFKSDILPGDVLMAIGNDRVQSVESYIRILNKYEGRTAAFHLDRDGKPLEKQIEILSLPRKTGQ
jgi:membrane-associated protease RseP (regulator of RpoE activity)